MAAEMAAPTRIVVVGGGPAGLRAARRLHEEVETYNALAPSGSAAPLRVEVIVLEATGRCGGRVRQRAISFVRAASAGCRDGLATLEEAQRRSITVELGAEVMHGRETFLTRTADEQGWPRRALCVWAQGDGGPLPEAVGGGVSKYFDGASGRWYANDDDDEEFRSLNDFFEGMCDAHPREDDDRSVLQALRDAGASDAMLAMGEAGYANTLGTSLDRLSWREMCSMEEFWDGEGEEDSKLEGTFGLLLRHMEEGLDVRTGHCVESIQHRGGPDGDKVRVSCAACVSESDAIERESRLFSGDDWNADNVSAEGGESFECDFAIVTVPLPLLQDGAIAFDPPLPERTQRSIASLGWARHTVKLHMLFSKQFWQGQDIHGIIAANCEVPEMWFDRRPRPMGKLVIVGGNSGDSGQTDDGGNSHDEHELRTPAADTEEELLVVVGFAMDSFAEKLSGLGEEEAVKVFLRQLDAMFRKPKDEVVDAESLPRCALGSDGAAAAPIATCSPSSVFLHGQMTDWSKNPFARGGYSYPQREGSREARSQLAAVDAAGGDARVVFAGEHTGIEHCTTVHAAVETGERAAKLVMQRILSQ